MSSSSIEQVLSRYRSYGPVYKPGDKVPVSCTYICDRGTMLPPVRVQLTKGDTFPEAEGLGPHTRWRETNIQG